MHVLVTADTVGGVWTYTRELVCGLLERGHRVTLVSFGGLPDAAQSFWLARKNLTYYPTEFPLEWMQNSAEGLAESAKYLQKIIAATQPDLLHLNQFYYGAVPCGAPRIVVAHSDVISWWTNVHGCEPPDSPWIQWYRGVVAGGLLGADAVVAPSQWMLDQINAHYEVTAQSYAIYNGRSPNLFHASARKIDRVLAVGRIWDEAKQIRLLLERSHTIPVWIAGKTEHPENRSSSHQDCHDSIFFLGEMSELQLRDLLAESAIYAATSRYEPFGLAPVEAALSHCVLIANDIPSFRELWGDAAFYFATNDASNLAENIELLCVDKVMRTEFSERAHEHARNRFTAQRMVDEYEQLYCRLVGESVAA